MRRGRRQRKVQRARLTVAVRTTPGRAAAAERWARGDITFRRARRVTSRRRLLQSRRPHEMDVVGHQGIAGCVEAEALAVLAEEFELRTAVVINEENILTVVAALNNVVRLTRNDDSGHARHAHNLPSPDGKSINR